MKQYALSQLPHYMVPSRIIAIDELPITPHGKVDRQGLSAMSKWMFASIIFSPL